MNKGKILLALAGFVFTATWAASAEVAAQNVECRGNSFPLSRGQSQQEDIEGGDFNDIDDNENQHICCKRTGSGSLVCKDDV